MLYYMRMIASLLGIPMNKTIGELQHEYLSKLLSTQKANIAIALLRNEVNPIVTNVSRGIYLLGIMNQYRARMLVKS